MTEIGGEWRIAAWILAGLAVILFLATYTDLGTGMHGGSLMMAGMWLWILLPFLFVVLMALIIAERMGRTRS